MFFNSRNKGYIDTGQPVRYLDGSSLTRPIDLPRKSIYIAGIFVLVASIIGIIMLINIFDNTMNSSKKEAETVQANIARDVSYDLPSLSSLIVLDNEDILQSFTDAGLVIYNKTNTEENPDGLDLVKLPADVSEAQAATYYAKGLNKLSATDASRLFKGSWTLNLTRDEGCDVRVKYVDFSSGSVDAALQAAIAAEGLSDSNLGDAGTDEAGNTYQEGTININDTTYNWRASAIALSSVYNISGLPNTAVYVGVRLSE